MTIDLDRELERAVEADLVPADPRPLPDSRIRPFQPRTLKVNEIPEARPERAADQISMACAGLLKAEDELRGLARDLVGDLADSDKDEPSSGGPLLPRLRSDAELMARLAIRLVKLCEEVRSKL